MLDKLHSPLFPILSSLSFATFALLLAQTQSLPSTILCTSQHGNIMDNYPDMYIERDDYGRRNTAKGPRRLSIQVMNRFFSFLSASSVIHQVMLCLRPSNTSTSQHSSPEHVGMDVYTPDTDISSDSASDLLHQQSALETLPTEAATHPVDVENTEEVFESISKTFDIPFLPFHLPKPDKGRRLDSFVLYVPPRNRRRTRRFEYVDDYKYRAMQSFCVNESSAEMLEIVKEHFSTHRIRKFSLCSETIDTRGLSTLYYHMQGIGTARVRVTLKNIAVATYADTLDHYCVVSVVGEMTRLQELKYFFRFNKKTEVYKFNSALNQAFDGLVIALAKNRNLDVKMRPNKK